ncbi:MAG: nitrogenase cofactor biosynthesis protein NifB [Ruminococcus sp.]|jgi:nitrogenase cofactor biosynthesis protein NifB|nr:nitrogenase cofactor biosynthesis protein NifB [Ruminococcus sp.]
MTESDKKTLRHPCYSGGCKNGRIHLPVAPKCNIQCKYCNRKFDCVNESRPGVTSDVLTPEQAVERFIKARAVMPNIEVVGIAGPGDALANFEQTADTFRKIRAVDPDVVFCLSTNGLYLDRYADELVDLGVTHITVTLNTIDPEIGARIYKTVSYDGVTYTGLQGASLLLEKQLSGLEKLRDLGVVAKVNTVLIKGVNDSDIENVAETASKYGVYIGNVMQLIPAPGSEFENNPLTSNAELNIVRKTCGQYIKQMYHCQQCRADAVGLLGSDCSANFRNNANQNNSIKNTGHTGNFTVSVTSNDRRIVNQHFGHADKFYIYTYNDGLIRLKEIREVKKYCEGIDHCGEDGKSEIITAATDGCDYVLTMRIGEEPRRLIEGVGKKVIASYGYINEEILKIAVCHETELSVL